MEVPLQQPPPDTSMQASLWAWTHYSLTHHLIDNATFLAERLVAETPSEPTRHLLATCHHAAGAPARAAVVLASASAPANRYLLALCQIELGKLAEAQRALLDGNAVDPDATAPVTNGAAGLYLMGIICYKSAQRPRAIKYLTRAVAINPFLWSAYQTLAQLGAKLPTLPSDPPPLPEEHMGGFCLASGAPHTSHGGPMSPFYTCSGSPLLGLANAASIPVRAQETPLLLNPSEGGLSTGGGGGGSASACFFALAPPVAGSLPPQEIATATPCANKEHANGSTTAGGSVMSAIHRPRFSTGATPLLMTASEGVGAAAPPLSAALAMLHTPAAATPTATTPASREGVAPGVASRRRAPYIAVESREPPPAEPSASSRQSHFGLSQMPSVGVPVRRSSRLSGGGSGGGSVGEEGAAISESSDAPVAAVAAATGANGELMAAQMWEGAQRAMALLRQLAEGFRLLADFKCQAAVDAFKALPLRQYSTGWVLTQLARAYFEMVQYPLALKIFEQVHEIEPQRLSGIEIHSTILWHLKKEVKLCKLAKKATELEKNSPYTCMVVGNCFSLQKEHDTALRFFQRAIQLRPNFAYAYTLSGHEHSAKDDFEKAMACYRAAIRIDERHYNAWYGLGNIYYRQEKFDFAEHHLRKALNLNPCSSPLHCYLGMALHSNQKSSQALRSLNDAIAIDDKNPLARFQKTQVLISMDDYEAALAELKQLAEVAPKEGSVFYALGRVYKRLGQTSKAMMCLTRGKSLTPISPICHPHFSYVSPGSFSPCHNSTRPKPKGRAIDQDNHPKFGARGPWRGGRALNPVVRLAGL